VERIVALDGATGHVREHKFQHATWDLVVRRSARTNDEAKRSDAKRSEVKRASLEEDSSDGSREKAPDTMFIDFVFGDNKFGGGCSGKRWA